MLTSTEEIEAKLHDHRGAIADFTKAIDLDPKDKWSYYKRGLSKIALKQKESGCLDLSKAGELGIEHVYIEIKEHCQ